MRKLLLCLCVASFGFAAFAQNLKMTSDQKGRIGYADENGNLVIPCKYESGQEFNNGIALVSKGKLYGYIDETGKEVLPIKYSEIGAFESGVAKAKSGAVWGLVDEKAQIVLKPTYSFIGEFNEYGKALVNKGGKLDAKAHIVGGTFGIIDRTGKELVPCKYKVLMEYGSKQWDWSADKNNFNQTLESIGLSACYVEYTENYKLETDCSYLAFSSNPKNRNNLAGLIDGNGNEIVKENVYNRLYRPSNGMMQFYRLKGQEMFMGYYNLDTKNEVVIKSGKLPKTYKNGGWDCVLDSTYVCPFYGKIAPISLGVTGKIYFVDKSGSKISPLYLSNITEARNNNSGVIICHDGISATMYDYDGNTIFEKGEFQKIDLFDVMDDTRVFPVLKDGKYGAVDEQKNIIIPFEYDNITRSMYGKFYVNKKGKWGVVDTNNSEIVPIEFEHVNMGVDQMFDKCWVQISEDNLWYIYDMKSKTIYGHGYQATSGFSDNFALVIPVDEELAKMNRNAGTPYYPANYTGEKSEMMFIVVNSEGTVVLNTPVPNNATIIQDIKEVIKKNDNQPLTKTQEKSFILKHNAHMRFYKLGEMLSEQEWDY